MEPSYRDIQELRTKFNRKVQEENKDFHHKDILRANSEDSWLRRFLLHHELDQKEALDMLMETCEWRKSNKVNELNENNLNRECLAYGSLFIHNKDKDGKPLFIFKCSKHVKGQKDFDELKRCVIYWFERADKMTDQITIFFDMLNTGLSNMDLDYTKYLINLCKLYYPNFLNYILIFEMPWVLNAGFKIIKSWLPAKAVQKIKFVSRANLKDFVDPSQSLISWGGTDPYEFVFLPDTNEWTKTEENKKKVHFAGVRIVDQDSSGSFEDMNKDDSISSNSVKVRVSPNDAITFCQEGIEVSGSLTITNISEGPITFKVKTTSRDKFRVRPYCGALLSGESVNISVLLLSDFKSSSVIQDKFLVMTLPLDSDNPSNDQINEAWKNSDSHKQRVEEFRLRCRLDSNLSQTNSHLNGAVGSLPASSDLEQKMSHLLLSVSHLSRICSEIETELKTWRRFVVALVIVCVIFGIAILYAFSNFPQTGSNHCHSDL